MKWSGASLPEFQTLFCKGALSGMTDRQLLDRFMADRDEAAFAGLVERHGSMVWGVCRRILGDHGEVGDAFQATFLVLVRRASSVWLDDSLGPWLYGVSLRVAKRARLVAIRRRQRERTNTDPPEPLAQVVSPHDTLRPLLDEELRRLPPPYRTVLILCYIEGLTHEEAARQLSCPVGTVRSRLARGRNLLRSRLERRGIHSSSSCLIVALAPISVLPESLTLLTAQAAARLAAGRSLAGLVSVGVEALVSGVNKTMILTKVGFLSAVLAIPLLGLAALANQERPPTASRSFPTKPAIVVATTLTTTDQEPASPKPGSKTKKTTSDTDSPLKLFAEFPAVVVKTVPPMAAIDVDPDLTEIRVTFSKEMLDGSWSWAQQSKPTFPEVIGKPSYASDKRTCILPVKLESNKSYAIWLNSPKFANFKQADGQSAVPQLLLFHTRAH